MPLLRFELDEPVSSQTRVITQSADMLSGTIMFKHNSVYYFI